jgi:gluconate 2-dehydrogenase gamma chain
MAEQVPPEDSALSAADAPPPVGRPTRRKVLTIAAVTAAGAATGVVVSPALNRAGNPTRVSRWRILGDAEASLLDAICEQIIPADQDPGARQAGVVNFIDLQLAGPYRRFQERYRQGLSSLQATCQALHQKPFEQLAWDQQTALLKSLEAGKAPKAYWRQVSSGEFFRMVVSHTMQGFYGSPRHGGNRDYVSYRMLGLEYPRVIGRNTPRT